MATKITSFSGTLSKRTANKLEKEIAKIRALHRILHKKRVENDLR